MKDGNQRIEYIRGQGLEYEGWEALDGKLRRMGDGGLVRLDGW